MSQGSSAPAASSGANDKLLFWACFIALIATAFGFIIRAMIMNEWGREFGLSETQKGEIFGVGLWPFAISIVVFSLIIDKIGYGKAMVFAFFCHVTSAVFTIATPLLAVKFGGSEGTAAWSQAAYWSLYLGNFVVALGNGTVEAVINPVVATMFPREKTKWLNILHAGWPGGLVLGGVLAIGMSESGLIGQLAGGAFGWQAKVGLILIPVIAYGLMMLPCKFPVNERVAAGVPYKAMLQEVGVLGCLIVSTLIVWELARVFEGLGLIFAEGAWVMAGWSGREAFSLNGYVVDMALLGRIGMVALVTGAYGAYTQSLGRPLFILLLLVMIPLATTELGTDSWITPLMEQTMAQLKLNAGWVLVYTSLIMMILRFFAGPIVHKFSPLGLLAVSSLVAAVGLVFLSKATGLTILAAATVYGLGKTFFWPTMLGVVAERFPKGGALTLNTIAGVGMLGVGVVGAALLGNIQDSEIDRQLQARHPELHEQVAADERLSVFGRYQPLDARQVAALPKDDQQQVETIQEEAKKNALFTVAVFPIFMLLCYLGMIVYFRTQGGYKAIELTHAVPEDVPAEKYTGGVEGPADP